MSKETIFYIGGFELPDRNAAAHRVLSNGLILKKLGYRVVFIGIEKNIKNETITDQSYKEIQGFECWSIPYPSTYLEWYEYLVGYNKIKKILGFYDDIYAVIAYNYQAIALWRMVKKYKDNIKIISDTTEWYNNEGNNFLHRQLKKIDTYLRMNVVNKQVDALIVSSNYLAEIYREKHVAKIPTLIVKICTEVVQTNANSIPKIIYSGMPFRLGKHYKNKSEAKDRLDIVFELFHTLHQEGINFNLNVYGINKEQYLYAFPDHNSLVNDMIKKVIFYGYVDSNTVRQEISRSDFSIFIRDINKTTMAGFPTKFTESIMCGTPVITTNTSDLNDYMLEGSNGFFLDFDKNNAVLKLKKILSLDKVKVNRMKEYCYKSEIFSPDLWVDVMDELLKCK